jgi:hypothetical protein
MHLVKEGRQFGGFFWSFLALAPSLVRWKRRSQQLPVAVIVEEEKGLSASAACKVPEEYYGGVWLGGSKHQPVTKGNKKEAWFLRSG